MSLWSIISGNGSQSGSSLVSSTHAAAISKLQGDKGNAAGAATSSDSSDDNGVRISAGAQAAAAEADDNKKDFGDLTKEIRSSLDTLYAAEDKAGEPRMANFANLSGRALSAIVLNQGNQFTPAERRQAKDALNHQTQQDFIAATKGGMSMSSLSSYSQSLVSQYDAMSPEERQARGWTQSFRDNAARVVSEGSLSLFDQIGTDS